jgi:hypothetical protein
MLSVIERLQEWFNLIRVPVFQENPAIEAGRKGEWVLRNLVATHVHYKDAHTFVGKRVPVPGLNARKEIDLIVVSPQQLHILEAKNWSGELLDERDRWVQIKRNGDRVEFPNLVSYNSDKCKWLLEYLRNQGISLPNQFVSQKVIFLNPNLKLSPSITNSPDVITYEKIQAYLDKQKRQSLSERLLFPVIEYCLSTEKAEHVVENLLERLSSEKLDKTVRLIESLSTWDRLIFHGTKVQTGDLLKIQTRTFTVDRTQLDPHLTIEIHWSRGKFWALLKALFGKGMLGTLSLPGYGVVSLQTEDFAKFQEAGVAEPTYVSLSYLDRIILG